MVYAVGLAGAIFIFWLALAQSLTRASLIGAALAAVLILAAAWRLRLIDREGAALLFLPRLASLTVRRLMAALAQSVRVSLSAVSPLERLKPGFVRLRVGPASGLARAAHGAATSAAPGAVIVDADETSVLLHVWSEPAALPAALLSIERETAAAIDGRQR